MSLIRNVFGRYFGKPVEDDLGDFTEGDWLETRIAGLTDREIARLADRAARFSDTDIIPAHHSKESNR
jgi:hypothetical protein